VPPMSPFGRTAGLGTPARVVLDALDAAGLTSGTLDDARAALGAAGKPNGPSAARAMLSAAAAAGVLTFDGDAFAPVTDPIAGEESEHQWTYSRDTAVSDDETRMGEDREVHPLRLVAFDVESAARARIEDGGAVSRDVWEIGASRFGPDAGWVAAQPTMRVYVEMREGFAVYGPRAGDHSSQQIPAADAWAQFVRFTAGADMLVAYNGSAIDFPLLDAALQTHDLDELDLDRVDALYLAHCLWPAAGRHTLSAICDAAGIALDGQAHHALVDAINLGRLMQAGAARWQTQPAELRELVCAITPDSNAWRMLRALAVDSNDEPPTVALTPAVVLDTLTNLMSERPVRRNRVTVPLTVPAWVRGDNGSVSPFALARRLHGQHVEARPSQQQVADAVLEASESARPVMIEAPTGTGKSLAALASALEWVDRDPQHKAIIATHTKQLQGQLAREIEDLSTTVPGLLDTSDLVKGASNRLSLRGLVYTIVDSSGGDAGSARHLIRHSDDSRYRELLAYLTLRLVAPDDAPSYRWAASSVDVVDVPPFLLEYCGPALSSWLGSLSQTTHGEYRDPGATPLAAWTCEVRESLAGHRVIVANHALLLAHWEDLAADANDLMLIVDEAHALEGAATDALSPELSTADVDDVIGSLTALARDLGAANSVRLLQDRLGELRMWWSDLRLRTHVAHTLDRAIGSAGAREGSRTLTLASPSTSEHAARDARVVERLLTQLHGLTGRVAGALGQIEQDNAGNLDPFEEQRLLASAFRVGALSGTCEALSGTLHNLLNPPPLPLPDLNGGTDPTIDSGDSVLARADADDADVPVMLDEETDAEAADTADENDARESVDDDVDDARPDANSTATAGSDPANTVDAGVLPDPNSRTVGAPVLVPTPTDRVVYVSEDGPIGTRGIARYRFSIRSSPVRLPLDPDWQALLASFRRLSLMSATLQVHTPGKDTWAYARSRLGLTDARTEVIEGPFDYRRQARLVAFDDFPSWAEQPKQAMRTVAHQLRGYARHVIYRPQVPARGEDPGDASSAPWAGGAMVLTTSRNAAAGIAHELTLQLVAEDLAISVHDQTYLGTARSVAEFTGSAEHNGGFLVGTRGLWTGVDISDPTRMHLVWINKLPFPVFTDPVVAARKEQVRRSAEAAGDSDPDLVANSEYYLPLAALDLRQAVGRLIRNANSRGVVVISDRKLGGELPLRQLYREIFLGSLDPGLHVADPDTGERVGGNVVPMREGWEVIWRFLHAQELLRTSTGSDGAIDIDALCTADALERHTVLPATLAIRRLALSDEDVAAERAAGTLDSTVLERAETAATLLSGKPVKLRPEQRIAIAATARGDDVLALLPTGYGKSYCFQLPALVLPGLTIVISPLVSLMHNQAVNLNGTIGGAVRALVGSLPESSSRAGRTEVVEQMTDPDCAHGIRIVYVSPERLSQTRFRQALERGVARGIIRRVAIDEAHTYVQWGEDFRPSFRRAGGLLRRLRSEYPETLSLITLTATATPTVEAGLVEEVLSGLLNVPGGDAYAHGRTLTTVRVNPMRPELQLARRSLRSRGQHGPAALAEQVVEASDGHVILYCLTVREVDRLHAHLRDYLDGRPVILRKFHGRLSEVEKASVSNEFVEVPRVGEEGYAQMIVVATSAFGLGIDRDDIRTVMCVSPATDLAALYQQLGRGGRDVAGSSVDEIDVATYALALGTSRSLDTAQWLAQLDLPIAQLEHFGRVALAAAHRGALDASGTAERLLEAEVAAGRMTQAQAREPRQRDAWRTGLIRAVATLADLGVVLDHGDLPERVALTKGTRIAIEPLHMAVRNVVLDLPVRGAAVASSSLKLTDLHALLRADERSAQLYSEQVGHTAQLWLLLCDMHDASVLDVSQRTNSRMLTGLSLVARVPARPLARARTGPPADGVPTDAARMVALPAGYTARISGKQARAATEAQHLRAFFAVGSRCLNALLAEYFSVAVPEQCCSREFNMCSVCRVGPGGPGPASDGPVRALLSARLRPAGFDPVVRGTRVDDTIVALLRGVFNGATSLQIRLVLRGETRVWVPRRNQYMQLAPGLRDAPQRGHLPDLTDREVTDSLIRLVATSRVVPEGPFWRTAANAARGPRRVRTRPAAAGAAAPTTATAGSAQTATPSGSAAVP
jgi:RecQ family ATP-dependent DNA helicase